MPRERSSRGFGLASTMPSADYEHRTKPARNRTASTAKKVKPAKPTAHRVGRTKK